MTLYKRGTTWWTEFIRGGRRVRRSLKTRDRRIAEARERDLIAEHEAAGTSLVVARRRPLEVAEEWLDDLLRTGRDERYVRHQRRRIYTVLCELPRMDGLTTQWIAARLGALARERGWAPGTQNNHRGAVKALVRWLQSQGRWGRHNPAAAVSKARHQDGREPRRALTWDELTRLVDSVPPYRAAAYAVAGTSGARRGELRSLTVDRVHLDGPHLVVVAGAAKSRREEVVPLSSWAVGHLSRWLEDRPADAGPLVWSGRLEFGDVQGSARVGVPLNRTLVRDCRAAGIEVEGPRGAVSFHCLRTTAATLMAIRGVPLPIAQRVLRHHDPRITARHYWRVQAEDASAALDRALSPE